MNSKIIEMAVEREIAKSNQTWDKLDKLSSGDLEKFAANYISNPFSRTYMRYFASGHHLSFYQSIGSDNFNESYIPSSREHRIAREILAQRKQ